MPIYEYQCQSCQKTFEYMQRMSEDAKTECEECKGALERLISSTSFSLKGGGWYKDLYASTKKDSKGSGESAPSPSAAVGASSSSDATSSKPSKDSSSAAASSTPAASAPAASAAASSTSSGSKSSD